MKKPQINPRKGLIPFTIVIVGLSSILFLYLYLGRQPVVETHGLRKGVAEGLGVMGLSALLVIYCRSMLKLTLSNGTFLQRIVPDEQESRTMSASRKLLFFLNRTHKYVGATAIVLLAGHATLMGISRLNPFLFSVLCLLVWQGMFGLFIVIRVPYNPLKKYGRLAHAQFFTGIMIGVFAGFGHLLV